MEKDLSWSEAAKNFKMGKYRHFKGGEYQIVCIARDSESKEEVVIYQNLTDKSHIWARPLAMFLDEVDRPELHYKGPRFTFIR